MPGSYCSSVDGNESEVAVKSDVECTVFLLDGNATQIPVQKKMKAADLIQLAHKNKDIDVDEKDFFSLFYFDTISPRPQKIFLNPKKRVRDQLPSAMKKDWRLHYGVKYYVSDSNYMKEDRSRYLLCLQLCSDIKDNRVLIDRETAARLTALMLQASLGDYDESEHPVGYTQEFTDFILVPQQELPEDYEEQLVAIHKAKAGLSPAQAETEFLQVARTLPRYGMHLYTAQLTPAEGSREVTVGISYRGITLFTNEDDELSSYPWDRIVTVEYTRKKVYIYFRNEPRKGEPHLRLLHCGLPPQAKKIWRCAVEQHTFFRLHRSKPDSVLDNMIERIEGTHHHGPTLKEMEDIEDDDRREEPKLVRSYSERLVRPKFTPYAPGYVRPRNSFRQSGRWKLLGAPPTTDDIDGHKTEEQSVQVTMLDVDPDKNKGSVLVLNRGGTPLTWSHNEPDGDRQQEFRLKEIDPEAATTTTSVSVVLDSRPMKLSMKKNSEGTTIYDSTRIPDVKLKNADDVTTSRTLYAADNEVAASGELQKTDN